MSLFSSYGRFTNELNIHIESAIVHCLSPSKKTFLNGERWSGSIGFNAKVQQRRTGEERNEGGRGGGRNTG